MKTGARFLVVSAVLMTAAPPCRADAIFFSLDPASPSLLSGFTPDDILAPGPVLVLNGTAIGLTDVFPIGYDHLNALSFGRDPISGPLFFSVDRVSVGLPGTAVAAQGALGANDAAASIFRSDGSGTNQLIVTPADLGLIGGFFGDDLASAALADPSTVIRVYFSVDLFSVANLTFPGLAASILTSTGGGVYQIFAWPPLIGLSEFDDIDALAFYDAGRFGVLEPGVDKALFSISKFSQTSLVGGVSGADVLYTDFTGSFSVYASAASLGLDVNDELNALYTIPEPSTLTVLAVLGLLGLGVSRRFCAGARRPTRRQ